MPQQKLPEDIVAQILLGEAADQGIEGLEFVADTMFNRSRKQKKTLEQVATAPAQFSAFARPDLAQFYSEQPTYLRQLAGALVEERRNPSFTPKHQTMHYVTEALWKKRNTLPKDHWLRKMQVVEQVGNHVALREAAR